MNEANVNNFRRKFGSWFRSRRGYEQAEIGLEDCLGDHNPLVRQVALFKVREELVSTADSISELMSYCESPIEQDLLAALITVWSDDYDINYWQMPIDIFSKPTLHIEPQFKAGKFRIDFRVRIQLYDPTTKNWDFIKSVLVECDGHDFHERTKEQAQRDRSKDRYFQKSSMPLLRFTGSEIYADPFRCATEVIEFLERRAGKDV